MNGFKIYNEQVRDLLSETQAKGGMQVRQHPKKGFYVVGLRVVPVANYADIEARIEEVFGCLGVSTSNHTTGNQESYHCCDEYERDEFSRAHNCLRQLHAKD